MKREILFRGLSNQGKGWLYGDVVRNVEGAVAIMPPYQMNMDNTCSQNEVTPDTIGQYTGLKDKEGNKIFEGDIVEFTNLDLPNMVVRFDNGSFMLCEDEYSTYEELRMNYAVEVVGNIYDHPELME